MTSPQEIETAQTLATELRLFRQMVEGSTDSWTRTPGLVFELKSFTAMGTELAIALNSHSRALAENTRALTENSGVLDAHTRAMAMHSEALNRTVRY